MSGIPLDTWLTIVGLLGGSIAFGAGLRQYVSAQRWKRAEWISARVSEFREKPSVWFVLRLLEYGERTLPVPSFGASKGTGKPVRISGDQVAASLDGALEEYSALDLAIRDSVNAFIEELEHFEYFVRAGLVSHAELKPYLEYYLDRLGSPDSDLTWRQAFWRYVDEYFYDILPSLFREMGYETPLALPANGSLKLTGGRGKRALRARNG